VFGLFFVSWFTDALDGLMARKYDMKSEFGAHLDYIVDVSTTLATLSVLFLRYYKDEKRTFALFLGIIVLLHIGQTIKLKNTTGQTSNLKPWEKILHSLPIEAKTNVFVNAIDPGMSYVTLLSMILYALVVLKKDA
jgi:phosphatidylglycerophosphate synthase